MRLELVSWLDRLLDFVLDPVEELVLALGPVGIGWGLGPGTCTSTWVRPVLVDGCCGWVRRSGVCCGFGCGLGFGSCFCDSLSLSLLLFLAGCSGNCCCLPGLFAGGLFSFLSASSLTPCFRTPSSASLSACSFPSSSTCDGTLTHSCLACLLWISSSIRCHRSTFLMAWPFFVFHPLLLHPASHSVAPSVTS